jgi:hypothetical protein
MNAQDSIDKMLAALAMLLLALFLQCPVVVRADTPAVGHDLERASAPISSIDPRASDR